jgi:FKBP-type peptidyl-prolyl cis-trans isomerase 2
MAIFGDYVILDYEIREKDGEMAIKSREKGFLMIYGFFPFIILSLDFHIAKMKENEEKEIELKPEEAFGAYNPSLVKTFNQSFFGGKSIKVGDEVEIGDKEKKFVGTVKKIENGRVTVDFNNPFAGKTVISKIKIKKIIKDENEKIKTFLDFNYEIKEFEIKEKTVKIKKDKIKEHIDEIKYVFSVLFPEYELVFE